MQIERKDTDKENKGKDKYRKRGRGKGAKEDDRRRFNGETTS